MPLGIEFAGGTAVVVKFEQPTTTEQVRGALDKAMAGGEVIIQPYGDRGAESVSDSRADGRAPSRATR